MVCHVQSFSASNFRDCFFFRRLVFWVQNCFALVCKRTVLPQRSPEATLPPHCFGLYNFRTLSQIFLVTLWIESQLLCWLNCQLNFYKIELYLWRLKCLRLHEACDCFLICHDDWWFDCFPHIRYKLDKWHSGLVESFSWIGEKYFSYTQLEPKLSV